MKESDAHFRIIEIPTFDGALLIPILFLAGIKLKSNPILNLRRNGVLEAH
jgi:hypothetical protein